MADVREALDKDPNKAAYTVDDGAINSMIPRASDQIADILQHPIDHATVTDESRRGEQVLLANDGVLEITVSRAIANSVSAASITADFATWYTLDTTKIDIDGYVLRCFGVTAPISRNARMIAKVSYDGGYTTIPDRFVQATARLTAFMFMKRRAPFEVVQGANGQVMVPTGFPKDVLELIQRDIRVRP